MRKLQALIVKGVKNFKNQTTKYYKGRFLDTLLLSELKDDF
jgi:hypothetical protein